MTGAGLRGAAKAFVGAAVAAGVTAVTTAISDGAITREEVLAIAGAALLGGLAVWLTPNATRPVNPPTSDG